ncbi:methyltransferase, FxLD system [Micromonospora aurantiaca (nom. illeg.)]|uniref:methyltransferase, FxLD system n=1 Tax=Micromonospora aurantiaca (nom. illeg.) TaxID=47850 RepID=UPI0001BF23F8|nr:methyltransferase, FxLD system [Micromonospora aurantiaca]ADL47635.1 Protein-L-isoaspartate(D-aspartate) O-methyltransferase [Micromonospora aurantiaca ATCC 27029]
MVGSVLDTSSADEARARLADRLVAGRRITSPAVEAAFRRVPRHLFATDGVSVDAAYADDVVITRRDRDGRATSSISAPWLQAYMLEQAGLRPGARVLEIGSGGYNAALIADVVGPDGMVVTVDIDADVIDRARTGLDHAGYRQVTVVHGDGEYGHQPGAPYDAIIVTVETPDVAPAWLDQLAPAGALLVPLRIRGMTRCLTLRRHEDHLRATAALQCGFVPMQGDGRHPTRRLALRGDDIVVHLDDTSTEVSRDALTAALHTRRLDAWSPVTIAISDGSSFESLHLWLASQPRPFGTLTVDRERAAGLVDPQDRFVCPTLLTTGSFAYLAMRTLDDTTWQFGAHGFGPDADTLTADMLDLITVWDHHHRHGPGPTITVHPTGTHPPTPDGSQLLVTRRHAAITVTWSAPEQPQ